MNRSRTNILALAVIIGASAPASAAQLDEPGMSDLIDEPGVAVETVAPPAPSRGPSFRVDLLFGYASMLVDPDIAEGYGGGLSVLWGMDHRFGVELNVFVANNPYSGPLGELGDFTTFLAGNISVGPLVQITRPGARLNLTAEALLGTYLIVPPVPVQDFAWTLGLSFGVTLSYRIASWFGVGLKARYHLFNLATISGPELVDRKAFEKIGVIDRLELPAYVAFYFL